MPRDRAQNDTKMESRALDGLRGISAQVVFLAHFSAYFMYYSEWQEHWLGWSARVAVIAFFCLSGFVITRSICRRSDRFSLQDFTYRRIARIYPPYILALGVSWAAAFILTVKGNADYVASMTANGALRALTFTNLTSDFVTRIDGALWSLRLEIIAYASIGSLGFAVLSRQRWRFRLLAGVAAVVVVIASASELSFGLTALLWFGSGALASLWSGRTWRFLGPAALLVVCGGGFLTLTEPFRIGASDTFLAAIMQIAIASLMSGWISFLASHGNRALVAAAPLSRYSYTLYVIHMPLLALAAALHADAMMTFVVVQGTSWASALILERPGFYYALIVRLMGWAAPLASVSGVRPR